MTGPAEHVQPYARERRSHGSSTAGTGLGRATFYTSAGSLVARGAGLGAIVVAAVALKPSGLGTFAYMSATSGLLGALGILGFGPLVTRQIATSPAATTVSRDAAALVLAFAAGTLGVVAVGFCLVLDPTIGILRSTALGNRGEIVVVAVWGLAWGLNAVLLAIILGYKDFALSARATAARALAGAAGIIGAAITTRSALGCAVGATIADLAICGYLIIVASNASRLGGSVRRAWRSNGPYLLRMSVFAGAASIAIQFATWGVQQLLISRPGGYAANGGLAIANRLSLVITFLPNAIAAVALPILSGPTEARNLMSRRVRRIVFATLASAIAAAACVGVLVVFGMGLLGTQYDAYRPLILTMCAAGVAIAANNMMSTFAVAAHRLKEWIASDLVLAGALIGVAWMALEPMGENGIGVAYVAAYGLSALVLLPSVRALASGGKP